MSAVQWLLTDFITLSSYGNKYLFFYLTSFYCIIYCFRRMFSYGKLRIDTKNWNSDATVFTRKEKYEKLENNNLNIKFHLTKSSKIIRNSEFY